MPACKQDCLPHVDLAKLPTAAPGRRCSMTNPERPSSRRQVLLDSYSGLGGLALLALLPPAAARAATLPPNPLAPKPQHLPAKAKSCIFLFMEGGVSQMDLFEYKPALEKFAGKQMPKAERTEGELATFSAAPNRIVPPYWGFKQYGASGHWSSGLVPGLASS